MTTTITDRKQRAKAAKRAAPGSKERILEKRTAISSPEAAYPGPVSRSLRAEFGFTRKTLSRVTGLSERTLASWEAGARLNDANRRAMNAAARLLHALAEVVHKDAIAPWFETPNDVFGGLKPAEVMERGEGDRLWRMIYFLGSGAAS